MCLDNTSSRAQICPKTVRYWPNRTQVVRFSEAPSVSLWRRDGRHVEAVDVVA